jgi:tetratricopeptide (TPR) repeat protein
MKHFAAETLNNMGLVWLAWADYPRASQSFGEAADICRSVGSKSGEAWAIHNRAFLYRDQGRLKDACLASAEVVQMARNIEDKRLEATAILRLGNLYEYQGLFDKALESYIKAAEIQKQISDSNFRSNTLVDIALIMTREGEKGDAEEVLQESLKLKRKIGAPVGDLLCRIALFHLEKQKYRKDRSTHEQLSSKAEEENLVKAREYVELAGKEISLDQKLDLMLLTYLRGRSSLEKDPAGASSHFSQLKSMAEPVGMRKYSFLAAVGLGLAYERQGQWNEARAAFKEGVDYAEHIRSTLDPYERLTFLEGEEILGVKHSAPYEGLARVTMKNGQSEESLKWAEYTKARAFSESLAHKSGDVSFNIPEGILERDHDLEIRLASRLRALDKSYQQGLTDSVETIRNEIQELSLKKQHHLDDLRKRFSLFAYTKYPEPVSPGQAFLRDQEWVLAYSVTDPGFLVYLMHGNKLVAGSFKPVPRSRLAELVRGFREPMEIIPGKDDPLEKLKAFDFLAGKELADMLVGEILRQLPTGAPVIIVPDDALGTLPFEMLLLNDSGKIIEGEEFPQIAAAEFFGDRNPVSYYQSITSLSLVRTLGIKTKPSDDLLVMADPVFQQQDARALDAQPIMVAEAEKQFSMAVMSAIEESMGGMRFERLPLTGEMADSLDRCFDGRSAIYTGLKASKANFIKNLGPDLDQYGTLVFGTHGFFSKDNPHFREPILVLSLVPAGTDGFLRMSDVVKLKLNCDMVALTACQTGLGRHVSGEGTMGMGRAFQFAGARSVLTSLWSVSQTSSVKLVSGFFEQLKSGKSKLEALRLARAQLRQEGYDHPFFWASFILMGEVD